MNSRYSQIIHDVNVNHMNQETVKTVSEVIATLKTIGSLARREGLLALEDITKDINDLEKSKRRGIYISDHALLRNFLVKLLYMVIDGYDPLIIAEIAEIMVASNDVDVVESFMMLIIRDGVTSVQEGTNPRIIEEKLRAYLAFHHWETLELFEKELIEG